MDTQNPKKGNAKGIVIAVLATLLVVGGGAAAIYGGQAGWFSGNLFKVTTPKVTAPTDAVKAVEMVKKFGDVQKLDLANKTNLSQFNSTLQTIKGTAKAGTYANALTDKLLALNKLAEQKPALLADIKEFVSKVTLDADDFTKVVTVKPVTVKSFADAEALVKQEGLPVEDGGLKILFAWDFNSAVKLNELQIFVPANSTISAGGVKIQAKLSNGKVVAVKSVIKDNIVTVDTAQYEGIKDLFIYVDKTTDNAVLNTQLLFATDSFGDMAFFEMPSSMSESAGEDPCWACYGCCTAPEIGSESVESFQ
jgi:hypothetical protein